MYTKSVYTQSVYTKSVYTQSVYTQSVYTQSVYTQSWQKNHGVWTNYGFDVYKEIKGDKAEK